MVHSVGLQDRVGARAWPIRLFRGIAGLRKIFADGGHTGKWVAWTTDMFAAVMEIVERSDTGTFVHDSFAARTTLAPHQKMLDFLQGLFYGCAS
ncbi:MAG: hypothetical protein LBP86_10125 [Azoarcus sp.]|nr:hypothetical protein [Azoarcus sp.]